MNRSDWLVKNLSFKEIILTLEENTVNVKSHSHDYLMGKYYLHSLKDKVGDFITYLLSNVQDDSEIDPKFRRIKFHYGNYFLYIVYLYKYEFK